MSKRKSEEGGVAGPLGPGLAVGGPDKLRNRNQGRQNWGRGDAVLKRGSRLQGLAVTTPPTGNPPTGPPPSHCFEQVGQLPSTSPGTAPRPVSTWTPPGESPKGAHSSTSTSSAKGKSVPSRRPGAQEACMQTAEGKVEPRSGESLSVEAPAQTPRQGREAALVPSPWGWGAGGVQGLLGEGITCLRNIP